MIGNRSCQFLSWPAEAEAMSRKRAQVRLELGLYLARGEVDFGVFATRGS